MHKKIIKSALSVAVVLAMILSVSMAALAAEKPGIGIQIGGAAVPVPTTTGGDDHVYAPFRELFSALGAVSTFEPGIAGIVTASKGGLGVMFILDDYWMTLRDGTNSREIYIGAAAYMDDHGTVYVPVRYAAIALGYMVGWDDASNSVVLQSIDSLIRQSGATYSVFDRVLAAQREISARPRAVSGTFGLKADLSALSGKTSVPFTASGSVSGLVYQRDTELNLRMKTNASSFAAGPDDELDAETKAALSMLDNFELSLIVNSGTGMMYFKSPLLSGLMNLKDNVWLSLDFSDLTDDSAVSALSGAAANAASFNELLSAILRTLNIEASGADPDLLKGIVLQVNALLSDQVLVKTGDTYSTTTPFNVSDEPDAMKGAVKLSFAFNGTAFKEMTADVSLDLADMGKMTLSCVSDAAGGGKMTFLIDVPEFLTLDLKAAFDCAATERKPAAEPPAGSPVIPVDSLMMMPGGLYD